jgi:hypothetical protein
MLCFGGLRNGSYVMSWDSGFAVDLPNKPVATDTTLNPKSSDPRQVMVARVDEKLADVFEQITRVDEEIARAEQQLSKRDDAARHPSDHPQTRMNTFRPAVPGNRPSLGGRAVRAFVGLMLAACIGVVAIAWQSPSYGDAARQIIARWAPQLAPTLSLMLENSGLPAQPSQAATARTAPPQPAPLAQAAPEGVAPTAAALSPELTPLLQSMARDLATVGQRVEQLKASQEQMARDNANLTEQLKAGREEMARVIAKVSEQNLRPKIPEPLPRPTATATRKPVSTLPSPRATAQPHAEKTQLSSAPRAPMPLR